MRVVRPHTPGTPTSRTLTAALQALRPGNGDLVDAGFVLLTGVVALLGWLTTFDNLRFLAVGAVGLALGVLFAHLATALRWHWLLAVGMAVLAYFLLGPALAVPADAVAGFLPSVAALRHLVGLAVGGWMELLTTLPPVSGDSEYVALLLLIGLLAGVFAHSLARRTRPGWAPVPVPALVLVLGLALGTMQPAALLAQGLGFAVEAFLWVMLRTRRRQRLVGTGRARGVQAAIGAAVLAVSMLAGVFLAPVLPGVSGSRQVLRSYVQPPLEINQYPTPLAGFRTFSSKTLNLYHDQPLLAVSGLTAGSRLRLAVLDAYSGAAWSANGGALDGTGFQRLGSQVPNPPLTGIEQARIEVLPAYAGNNDLNLWLPGVGKTASVVFEGAAARAHQSLFRFNLATDQGLVSDRLAGGDVVTVSGAPLPVYDPGTETLAPGPGSLLGDASTSFLNSYAQKLGGPSNAPLERLKAIAETLKDGAWSDGTKADEQHYLPGHGVYRLTRMLQAPQIVGSDEQYASAFALLANIVGFPSRVVFGAVVPDGGQVQGKDIHVWVELQVDDGQWITVPDSVFTPDRNKPPKQTTNTPDDQKAATKVPPPNPVRPPASTDEMSDSQPASARIEATDDNPWLETLLLVLRWVVPPLAAILLIASAILLVKALRRRRRRTKGAFTTRIARGWQELVDQARDLGRPVPPGQTRLEQSRTLGGAELTTLATQANRAVFGRGDVTADQVRDYWTGVDQARRGMLKQSGFVRGLRGRLSLRSLLSRAGRADSGIRPRPRSRARAASPTR